VCVGEGGCVGVEVCLVVGINGYVGLWWCGFVMVVVILFYFNFCKVIVFCLEVLMVVVDCKRCDFFNVCFFIQSLLCCYFFIFFFFFFFFYVF